MSWLRRLLNRPAPRIPDSIWTNCVGQLHFLDRLSPADLARLKSISETLLARKNFAGAGGLELSDETAVLIAAQASLPILNLTPELYEDMAAVLVYPAAFVIQQSEMDEAGVVHEWREPVSGEAIDAGGAVVLSWEDAQQENAAGHNVVIHEFAHKIDMRDGAANGCPPFLTAFHQDINPAQWQDAFVAAWNDFLQRVERLEECLPDDFDETDPRQAARYDELFSALPLDPYAARHPAEFFAVASEAFFVLPQPLAENYPEVYLLLTKYYLQDPLRS